jgi:hypothetical protein
MKLTTGMRDVLIEHIDRPVPIVRASILTGAEAHAAATRYKSVGALINSGCLRTDRPAAPRTTIITEVGRAALAAALADWADALARAGYGGPGFLRPPDLDDESRPAK